MRNVSDKSAREFRAFRAAFRLAIIHTSSIVPVIAALSLFLTKLCTIAPSPRCRLIGRSVCASVKWLLLFRLRSFLVDEIKPESRELCFISNSTRVTLCRSRYVIFHIATNIVLTLATMAVGLFTANICDTNAFFIYSMHVSATETGVDMCRIYVMHMNACFRLKTNARRSWHAEKL